MAASFFFAQPAAGSDDLPEKFSRLQNAEMRLVRLRLDGKDISIPADVKITLVFRNGGRVSGRSAVNSYGGVFTMTPDGDLTIKMTISTQMAGPPELMELERQYLDALSRVRKVLVKSGRVFLENDSTTLEFTVKS